MKHANLILVMLLVATATRPLYASERGKAPKTVESKPSASRIVAKAIISPPVTAAPHFVEPITGMEFLSVPGGCFQMGDNTGDADEKPAHQVCLDDYYIGKYEVTQGQWQQLMGTSPSFFSSCGKNCPVESINWDEAQDFISKLNRLNDRTFRLLTEAEWEYACRSGGKEERYCGGDDVNAVAWFDKNSQSQPHPVGGKQPNGLGIYDMSGNVWEWVTDHYQKNYYSNAPPNNPEGPATGLKRVMRGGSWYNDPRNVRARIRGGDEPDHRSINLGFRVACSANKDASPSR